MKISKRFLALGAASLAAIAPAVSADAHAAPYTVRAGTAANGTAVAFTGKAVGATFSDTTTHRRFICTSITLTGSIRTGTAASGTKLATVNGAAAVFSGCGGGGTDTRFAVTGVGTWYVNATDTTNGAVTVTLSNIVANWKSASGAACSFTLGSPTGSTGTVTPGTEAGGYTNSTQALSIPTTNAGPLGLWNLKGSDNNTYCRSPLYLKQGDRASLSGTFKIAADNASYNPISIT